MGILQSQQPVRSKNQNIVADSAQLTSSWMPSEDVNDALIQSSLNIKNIEGISVKRLGVLSWLRSTRLGKFYISNIRSYVFARLAMQCIRSVLSFYVGCVAPYFIGREQKRWRPLIKLSEFSKNNGISIFELQKDVLSELPSPRVFPVNEGLNFISNVGKDLFPEMFVAVIKNAMTYGGTNMVLVDECVVCHDLYDVERDTTSEELHLRVRISSKKRSIRWLLNDNAPVEIPVAATFSDACASNYAHWMTEVLPRIALFCAEPRFSHVPFVVNDGLHRNIMQSLFLIAGPDREIVTLPTGKALLVGELYVTSVAGYIPFGRRKGKLSGHSHGAFSLAALNVLRNAIDKKMHGFVGQVWPEKIFIRRNTGVRVVSNADEIERLLVSRGYVLVEPERLEFMHQIQLFRNAKQIISPTGAALSNAIFCAPDTRVSVLMGKHNNMIYRYWFNMLAPLQIKVFYVLGRIVKGYGQGIHGDFLVKKYDVIDLLDAMEGELS